MDRLRAFLKKLWEGSRTYQSELMLGVAVAAISVISFQAGKLYQTPATGDSTANLNGLFNLSDPEGAKAEPQAGERASTIVSSTPVRTDLRVVATKNAKTNKRYHYLWCGSAKNILEQNRVYFASAAEAETQGYTLAGNCTK